MHDNTTSGYTQTPAVHLKTHRMFYPFSPWLSADGTSVWDVNQGGGPFDSGTATGGGALTLTVAGSPWTTSQWVGYSVKKTSTCSTPVCGSEILSNTANTLTFETCNFYCGSNELAFANGETYAIYKVVHALDQPGRTRGSLISGETPTPPGGWNNQVTDPLYEWNNTQGASNINFSAGSASIRQNEHFYTDTAKPGYTPYIYPHPLVGQSANVPTMLRYVQ